MAFHHSHPEREVTFQLECKHGSNCLGESEQCPLKCLTCLSFFIRDACLCVMDCLRKAIAQVLHEADISSLMGQEQLGCTSAEMKLHFTSLSVLMAVMKRRDLLRNLF